MCAQCQATGLCYFDTNLSNDFILKPTKYRTYDIIAHHTRVIEY